VSGATSATPRTINAPAVASAVVLTATSDVWLRIYDQTGERLLEKEMKQGESFTVPPAANNPMILTGRPDALAVTVAGKAVPPLGPPEKTIADVPISASALLARGAAPAPTPPPAQRQSVPAATAPLAQPDNSAVADR
jgi:cytoskeleton protein RodZ